MLDAPGSGSPRMWEILAETFDYDRWANRLWFEALTANPPPDSALRAFGHLLSAQEIWFIRFRGESPTAMPEVELSFDSIDRLHREWRAILDDATGDPIVSYRRTTGEEYEMALSRIARHVVNHGTYHRGELRGLFRVAGRSDFPETDLMGFYLSPL